MRKQIIRAAMLGLFAVGATSAFAQEQTLQQFNQEDFDELMRTNPELLNEVIRADGSVDRLRLGEILRNDFDYADESEIPAFLDFDGVGSGGLISERSQEEIDNDVALQRRLAEERMKAFEKYKKRNGIE